MAVNEREREREREMERKEQERKRVGKCIQSWRCARDSAFKYLTILRKLPWNSTCSVAFSLELGVGIANTYYYNIYKTQLNCHSGTP